MKDFVEFYSHEYDEDTRLKRHVVEFAATTFILVRKDASDAETTKRILKFIDWNYRTGELPAMYLDFVVLPPQLIDQVRASWRNVKDSSGRSAWN